MFPLYYWIVSFIIIPLAISVDLGATSFMRVKKLSFKTSIILFSSWVFLALLFGIAIYFHVGSSIFTEYITAYLIELILGIDNVFVFIMIFQYFNIEAHQQHKVLLFGVVGAIIFRLLMIACGVYMINTFTSIFIPFGILLIYIGYRLPKMNTKINQNLEERYSYRFISKFFPTTDKPHKGCFFLKEKKKVSLTRLGLALLMIENADLLFALDSVPAVLTITREPFVLFSSNILAMIGLRSMYFFLSNAIEKFIYLKNATGLVLMYIGSKMIVGYFGLHVGNILSIFIIFILIISSIILSIFQKNKQKLL